jgi:hypothetical protein
LDPRGRKKRLQEIADEELGPSNLEGSDVVSVTLVKCIHEYRIFVLKSEGISPHKVVSVGGRIILNWILKELSVYMWIELNQLKLRTLLYMDFIKATNLLFI